MWKLSPDKPRVCYCKPGHCGAPKPQWCIGKRADEHPELITCPPGLLLSLGDGSAVLMPLRELARRIEEIERFSTASTFAHSVERAVDDAIQQAQEARDAG